MQKQNLFQVFSEIFIASQQDFSKCDVELRTKCRTLSERLSNLVSELENDAFQADLTFLSTLEEESLHILRTAATLEEKRSAIKDSVVALENSTKTSLRRK
tara:strand:+ start:490 stop:792 length:303 start_codon:yes stop_codon:yes gene_type:complete